MAIQPWRNPSITSNLTPAVYHNGMNAHLIANVVGIAEKPIRQLDALEGGGWSMVEPESSSLQILLTKKIQMTHSDTIGLQLLFRPTLAQMEIGLDGRGPITDYLITQMDPLLGGPTNHSPGPIELQLNITVIGPLHEIMRGF